MQHWKAHYKDQLHNTDIEIWNTEEEYNSLPLSFSLDGITFRSANLTDFSLADGAQYSEASRKFSLLKWGSRKSQYHYDLQRYELTVEIPMDVVAKKDHSIVTGILRFSFRHTGFEPSKFHNVIVYCDDTRVYPDDVIAQEFSLTIGKTCYQNTTKTVSFESALSDICRQMKDDGYIKNCFTCQYSDYSPYGNDSYGNMLCYRHHKEAYLKVNSKDDFFDYLDAQDSETKQETALCADYCPRNKASGYRGFVAGVKD